MPKGQGVGNEQEVSRVRSEPHTLFRTQNKEVPGAALELGNRLTCVCPKQLFTGFSKK